ncbi:MAG TPA: aminoglycoside phosphotransferase family protein [Gaiellaceae bacterium]|nr:aminoglycoside phosphotransferase family protein [Gaiellaceae bacterium]
MEKAALTPELVSRLLAAQFPQWAGLNVERVALDGWDNTSFRLGDELVVRLPSADAYAAQVDKEHRWLPVLAPHLPLPVPEPVARGVPQPGFSRPWSVYRWLPGEHATLQQVRELRRFATDLADFLAALSRVDPAGGPTPGRHNFFRGGPPTTYDREAREAIAALEGELDAVAATAVWEAALAARWHGPAVWVHGDVTASNLLVVDGRLSAVVDFGCSAVGDPACDTAIAWTFFAGDSRAAFRERLPVDDATWARGRGWALWKALVTLVAELDGRPGSESAHVRMGWRFDARGVIEEVLADHAA